MPAVVASLIGYAVYVGASGLGLTPVWQFAPATEPQPVDLAWAVGSGVLGAGVAIAFSFPVERAGGLMAKLPLDRRLLVGGAVLGLLGLLSPHVLTYAKRRLDPLLLTAAAPASVFVIAALAKFVGTTPTVASGWRGGFIIPLFFIGAVLGHAIHLVLPATDEAVIACALMAAINTGVTKTPLGSSLVVTKMVGPAAR